MEKEKSFISCSLVDAVPMTEENYRHLSTGIKEKDGYVKKTKVNPTGLWTPKKDFEKHNLEISINPSLRTKEPSISKKMVEDFIVDYDIFTKHEKITIVIATLKNGFSITESSACVSPENYDEEIGAEICKEKIKDKVWTYLGFLLQSAVYGNS